MDDIVRFLADHAPWRSLPPESVVSAVSDLQIEFFPEGATVSSSKGPLPFLVIVRTGALEARGTQSARLLGRFAEGDCVHGVQSSGEVPSDIVAVEDTLAYLMPPESLDLLLSQESVARFFRLRGEEAFTPGGLGAVPDGAAVRLRELPLRRPVTCSPDATIGEVALRMREEDEACAVLTGPTLGVVTDRILRNEVAAGGMPSEAPVSAIMQTPVPNLSPDATLLQAVTTMMRHETAYVPVLENGEVVSFVGRRDLIEAGIPSPLLYDRALKNREDDSLARYGRQLRASAMQLLQSGFSPGALGEVMAQSHDNLVRKLIWDAKKALGEAPGAFCWLVPGRLGRQEAFLVATQEHALAYEDGLSAADAEWFLSFANHVSHGLGQAGFRRSTREILATNPLWCRPASAWRSYFSDWAGHPDPAIAAQAAPFFDSRVVAGNLDEDEILPALREAGANRAFHARLTRNLIAAPPPLGFFRNAVLERDGTTSTQLDLASRVIVPIVGVARLVALEARLGASTTEERLAKASLSSFLDASTAGELAFAHGWLSRFRLERQAGTAQDTDPGTVTPSHLDPDDRAMLAACFRVLSGVLEVLRGRGGA
jgi:CBS domain-containing protein